MGNRSLPFLGFKELAGEPKICSRCVYQALTGEFRDWEIAVKEAIAKNKGRQH